MLFDAWSYFLSLSLIYFDQTLALLNKHISQRKRNGRNFWKYTIFIQLLTVIFITIIVYWIARIPESADVYNRLKLPPLSTQKPWGIFNIESKGNTMDDNISKRLYYVPNNHAGVNSLISSLLQMYPNIDAIGAENRDQMYNIYEANLFDTWATIEFTLSDDQISSQKLITSETNPSAVSYVISVNPASKGFGLSAENYTDIVYNKQSTGSDLFWSSGYLTLQNFVNTYLAKQYSFVDPNFEVRQ